MKMFRLAAIAFLLIGFPIASAWACSQHCEWTNPTTQKVEKADCDITCPPSGEPKKKVCLHYCLTLQPVCDCTE